MYDGENFQNYNNDVDELNRQSPPYDHLYHPLQHSSRLGFYCVDEETGEYIDKAVWLGKEWIDDQGQSVYAGYVC